MKILWFSPAFIRQEVIPYLRFPQDDVLLKFEERKKRTWDLERAGQLAREHQGKVKIIFRTGNGELKRVYATVLASDQESVTLAGGATLPTRSILALEFF